MKVIGPPVSLHPSDQSILSEAEDIECCDPERLVSLGTIHDHRAGSMSFGNPDFAFRSHEHLAVDLFIARLEKAMYCCRPDAGFLTDRVFIGDIKRQIAIVAEVLRIISRTRTSTGNGYLGSSGMVSGSTSCTNATAAPCNQDTIAAVVLADVLPRLMLY